MILNKPWISPKFPHISLKFLWKSVKERTKGFSSLSIIKLFLQNELAWLLTKHPPSLYECVFPVNSPKMIKGYVVPKWFSTLIMLTGFSQGQVIWCSMHPTPPLDSVPYSSHTTALSPEWISWHCLRMELWLKVLPYPLCSQGSSLPWTPRCLISSEHCLKVFLLPLCAYGFSPVWILWHSVSFTFMKTFTFIAFEQCLLPVN